MAQESEKPLSDAAIGSVALAIGGLFLFGLINRNASSVFSGVISFRAPS